MTQILVEQTSEGEGLRISRENWRNRLVIPVMANMDMLKDGDQEREITLVSFVRGRNETNRNSVTTKKKVSANFI